MCEKISASAAEGIEVALMWISQGAEDHQIDGLDVGGSTIEVETPICYIFLYTYIHIVIVIDSLIYNT